MEIGIHVVIGSVIGPLQESPGRQFDGGKGDCAAVPFRQVCQRIVGGIVEIGGAIRISQHVDVIAVAQGGDAPDQGDHALPAGRDGKARGHTGAGLADVVAGHQHAVVGAGKTDRGHRGFIIAAAREPVFAGRRDCREFRSEKHIRGERIQGAAGRSPDFQIHGETPAGCARIARDHETEFGGIRQHCRRRQSEQEEGQAKQKLHSFHHFFHFPF